MSLLAIDDLSVAYDDGPVVDRLSFEVASGEAVGLVGASGSGKTQTALAIMGLLPPNARVTGSIRLAGTELVNADAQTLDALRATRVAMVFQDPLDALNPYLRIGDQVGLILRAHRLETRGSVRRRVLDMLERVGLPDPERQYRAYPHELSGGMRQRAMIAAALIAEPALLIADEPTTALDVTVQAQILAVLDDVRQRTALLLITHDLGIVAAYCQRMVVLRQGRLVEAGATGSVFAGPATAHTRELLALAPRLGSGEPLAPVSGPVLLSLDGLAVSYRRGAHDELAAVKGIDLDVKSGETVAIVGESGSGKSSLARSLLGLFAADGGTITFDGGLLPKDIRERSLACRRDVQMVFQDPLASLNPQLDVESIVGEPLGVHRRALDAPARAELVTRALAIVGLDESYLGRYPHELSGGQAQRVAIARALVLEPRLLVCDEAVSALDGPVRGTILELLRSVQERTGLAIVFISHDLAVVQSFSHRIAVMYLGRIVEIGGAALFSRPRHPYTRALLDAVPLPDPASAAPPAPLPGEIPSPLAPPPGCEFHPRCSYAQPRCARERPVLESVGTSLVACLRAKELDLTGPTSTESGSASARR